MYVAKTPNRIINEILQLLKKHFDIGIRLKSVLFRFLVSKWYESDVVCVLINVLIVLFIF